MTTPAISPLSAYRQLLRATRIAFEGDLRTLLAARAEVRKHFDQNRGAGVDTPMKLQQAVEAERVLRTNVVQGVESPETTKAQGANEYVKDGKDGKDGNGQGTGSYTLRIHDEIERGDNDTVKINDGADAAKVKPCPSS